MTRLPLRDSHPELYNHIVQTFPLESSLHGSDHWARVEKIGLHVAQGAGADLFVVQLFALFHDCQRLTDDFDPGHGLRGFQHGLPLRGKLYEATDEQLELLEAACRGHTDGLVSDDPTIGACWDADRLDLMRAGIRPDPKLLSTEVAREPETIAWAVSLCGVQTE